MTIEEAAKQYRILYLGIGEAALRRNCFDSIFKAFGITPKDFDVAVFESGANSTSWIAEAGIPPFFADRRIVVVHNVFLGDSKSVDLELAKNLPESGLVILLVDDDEGDYDSQARRAAMDKNWSAWTKSVGGYVQSFEIKSNERTALLKEQAEKFGKKISPKAIQTLLEMVGNDLSLAIDEIEKLSIFSGNDKEIREEDVQQIVIASPEWNVFNMIDSIIAKRPADALNQLKVILGSTNKPEEIAFRQILPLISRSLNLIWQAKVCLKNNIFMAPIPEFMLQYLPSKPNLAGEKPYSQSKTWKAAKACSLENITIMLRLVADADMRLKGGLPSLSAVDTLERMVIEMAT